MNRDLFVKLLKSSPAISLPLENKVHTERSRDGESDSSRPVSCVRRHCRCRGNQRNVSGNDVSIGGNPSTGGRRKGIFSFDSDIMQGPEQSYVKSFPDVVPGGKWSSLCLEPSPGEGGGDQGRGEET